MQKAKGTDSAEESNVIIDWRAFVFSDLWKTVY